MADALFLPDGDRFVPTELARGPWSPDALHGGPVAALLARAIERVAAPGPMHPVRLTVELLRPVPLAPLAVTARVQRPGKKVQLVEAEIAAGDVAVARATVLRIRRADVPLGDRVAGGSTAGPPRGPDEVGTVPTRWATGEVVAYHNTATEHRAVRGVWGEPGPMTDWIRLKVPVVSGEAATPFQRVAAVADFGNGISSALPYTQFSFINPDLTIYLHRLPVGEWVCLDAATYPEATGIAVAESVLADERGRIGHALQGLVLERR